MFTIRQKFLSSRAPRCASTRLHSSNIHNNRIEIIDIGEGGGGGGNSGGSGWGHSAGDDSFNDGHHSRLTLAAILSIATGALLLASDPAHAALDFVLPLPSLLSSVKEVEKLFKKYAGKDKKLTLHEATKLLESEEFRNLSKKVGLDAYGMCIWSVEDVTSGFKKADIDHSGHLDKLEFIALWLGRVADVYKHHPTLIAEGLLEVIDKDHDGKISVKEVKGLLTLIGVPSIALLVLPDNIGVEYRGVLKQLGGGSGGSGKKGKK